MDFSLGVKIQFLKQIVTIGGRTAVSPVVRLFSYQGGFLQIFDRPLDSTAGQGQIRGYGFNARPCFAFFVLPIITVIYKSGRASLIFTAYHKALQKIPRQTLLRFSAPFMWYQ